MKKLLLVIMLLVVGLGFVYSAAQAESTFPTKPLTVVCPWAAGGGTDRIARFMAEQLTAELGQPVNVVNKTGGNGAVGHGEAANASPDGYTIGNLTFEVNTLKYLGYSQLTPNDFIPLAQFNQDAAAVTVSVNSPYNTVGELLDAIKSSPAGTFSFSGSGIGTVWDLARIAMLDTYGIANEAQLKLIPLGFNLDRFLTITPQARVEARAALDVPVDTVVVSTVGRLTAIKQHTLFLEMADRLVKGADRFVFLIVGDGELRASLEAQAAALGLGPRVRFLGWRGDLESIYAATDVFVLTSRNEGTPVALIEAMAAGVASVSTDVGGVRDVVTGPHLGSLVPFGDAAALVDAVRALADAPGRREAVGQAGRTSVRERFHANRLRDDIRTLYWQLLENSGTISGRSEI